MTTREMKIRVKFEYSDGRQVDQREEPEQENSENQYEIEELAEDDNEEWEIKPDSNTRPQLATTHKHIHIREEADKLYLRNAERMRMKYTKCKRKKVLTFSQGNVVSVRIPRIDRTSTDFHRIPCVVVERRGSKFFLYRLRYVNVSNFVSTTYISHRCAHSILKVCYGSWALSRRCEFDCGGIISEFLPPWHLDEHCPPFFLQIHLPIVANSCKR